MKTKLATAIFVVGSLLTGMAVHAQDMDREHPLTFVKDSAITAKIKAKLADDHMKSLLHISVDTDDHGIVVLSGHTRTREQADRAVAIANHTDGVTKVWNHIQIREDE
jgi:hyperosmotically inducible protein